MDAINAFGWVAIVMIPILAVAVTLAVLLARGDQED